MPDFPPIDAGRDLLRATFTNNAQPASPETTTGISANGFSAGLKIHHQARLLTRTQTSTTPISQPAVARVSAPQARRSQPLQVRPATGNGQEPPVRLDDSPQRSDRVARSDARTGRTDTTRSSNNAAPSTVSERKSDRGPTGNNKPTQPPDAAVTRQSADRDHATSAVDDLVQEASANGESGPANLTDGDVRFSPFDEIDAALSPPDGLLPLIVAAPSVQTEQLSYGDLLPDAISATEEFLLPAALPALIPGESSKLPEAFVTQQYDNISLLEIDNFSADGRQDESNAAAPIIETDLPAAVEFPLLNDALVPLDVFQPDTTSAVESEAIAAGETHADTATAASIAADVSGTAGIHTADEILPEALSESVLVESTASDRNPTPVNTATGDTSSAITTTDLSETSNPQPVPGKTVPVDNGASIAARSQLDLPRPVTRDRVQQTDDQTAESIQPAVDAAPARLDATLDTRRADNRDVTDARIFDNASQPDLAKSVSTDHTAEPSHAVADRNQPGVEPASISPGNSEPLLQPDAVDSNLASVPAHKNQSGDDAATPTHEPALTNKTEPTAGSAASQIKPRSAAENATVPADDISRTSTDEQRLPEHQVTTDTNQSQPTQDTTPARLNVEPVHRDVHSETYAAVAVQNAVDRFSATQPAESPADQPVLPPSPAGNVPVAAVAETAQIPEAAIEPASQADRRGRDRTDEPASTVADGAGQYAFITGGSGNPVLPGLQTHQTVKSATATSTPDGVLLRDVTEASGSADVEGSGTVPDEQSFLETDHGFSDRLMESTGSRPMSETIGAKPGRVAERTTTASRAPVAMREAVDAVQQAMSGEGHIRVRLNPPELGSLFVDVSRGRDGVLVARLEVESITAHQAVTDTLADLQQALNQSGVSVDRLELVMAGQASDGRGEGRDESSQDQPQREQSRQEQPGQEQSRDESGSRRQSRRDQHQSGASQEDFAATSAPDDAVGGRNVNAPESGRNNPAMESVPGSAARNSGSQNRASGQNDSIDVSL